jgi:hypothetical protein
MVVHPTVSGQDLRNSTNCISDWSPTLWIRLTPHLQKRLAQHWAKLVEQMQQRSTPSEEGNDVRSR